MPVYVHLLYINHLSQGMVWMSCCSRSTSGKASHLEWGPQKVLAMEILPLQAGALPR